MRARDENKIEAIFQQALEMIVNEGFDGLSMQKLAKAAGVSPATIYIYFKDKEDLLLQLHKRETERFFEYLMEGFGTDMDFATGMAVQWRRRAHYVIQNPLVAHFMEQFSFTPLYPKSMKFRDSRFKEAMHRFVNKAIEDKQLMPMPIEVYWAVSYAPLYSLVKFHKLGLNMAGEPFELTDEMLTQTLALVLKALKP